MSNSEFEIESYISSKAVSSEIGEEDHERFLEVCDIVKDVLDQREKDEKQHDTVITRQFNAIIGKEDEVKYYKNKINGIIKEKELQCEWFPAWYEDLGDAIFNELLGFSCVSEWIKGAREELKYSSSAKIIGNRIYYQIGGKLVEQPQRISDKRRMQFRRALLLSDPKKRSSEPYHEVYLVDGSRVTLFSEGISKKGQDTIIFRKFFVNKYTFEQQAELNTIPFESIKLFTAMVKIGFNVAFVGAVKTAKTTFLATWQSYEDQSLEGVQLETDGELPWHIIMPKAPIMQLVIEDENNMKKIIKPVMRADGDYIIMAEARDGIALNIAVRAANKGTRRVKMTYHTTSILDFCYDIADEIVLSHGGNLYSKMIKVAKSFQYVFHFTQLSDKSQKRLKAIWEIRYDELRGEIIMVKICDYSYEKDNWTWKNTIGEDKRVFGAEENAVAFKTFEKELGKLENASMMTGEFLFKPYYEHLKGVSR